MIVGVVSRPEHSVGSTAGGRTGISQEVGWKEWGLRVGQTDDDQAKGVAMGTGA